MPGIPSGYPSLRPYLFVDDAAAALEFYAKAFGATERMRLTVPGGKIAHAEVEIGDSLLMLCDPLPHFSSRPPKDLGGTTSQVFLYVEDVDTAVQRALDAGATLSIDITEPFWGDRFGGVTDPFGQEWLIATRVEDLSPAEMMERGRPALAR